MFHEPTVPKIQEVADEEFDGNKSDYIRQLVLVDLLERRKVTPDELKTLR